MTSPRCAQLQSVQRPPSDESAFLVEEQTDTESVAGVVFLLCPTMSQLCLPPGPRRCASSFLQIREMNSHYWLTLPPAAEPWTRPRERTAKQWRIPLERGKGMEQQMKWKHLRVSDDAARSR